MALLVLIDVVELLVLVGPGMVAPVLLMLLVLLVLVPALLLLMVEVVVVVVVLPLTILAWRPMLPTHASLTGHGNNDIVPLSALQ